MHRLEMKQKVMTWIKIPQTPTDRTTMNQNLLQEPKMKKVEVNHPIITIKRVGFETWRRNMIACYVEENEVKLNVEQLQLYEEVF